MKDLTTDEMIAYLEKAMEEKHHPDWLGWVGQNKIFKYKTIPINSLAPADGWEGDQNKIDNMAKSDLNNAPLIVVHKDGTMIDGNHRHQALKKQGAQTIQAYIGEVNENKLNFKLIDKEISEARLYRTTSAFGQLTGESVSELLYLNTLINYLMYKDDKQHDYAKAYAKQTIQYGKYTLFRSHATDLYLLAYLVSNPDSRSIKLRNNITSKKHLKSLKFDKAKHWQFLMQIANDRVTDTLASPYMFRLESQLKIKKSIYKQWRRLIMDWENLRYLQRQAVTTKIVQELRRLGRGSELMVPMTSMLKYKKYRVKDTVNKTDPVKRLGGTIAGAVAGRYVGKKVAQKFNKNVDKYKKAGTGLGAIAGYWASGRQRQK